MNNPCLPPLFGCNLADQDQPSGRAAQGGGAFAGCGMPKQGLPSRISPIWRPSNQAALNHNALNLPVWSQSRLRKGARTGLRVRCLAVMLTLASAGFGGVFANAQEAGSPAALLQPAMAQAQRQPASSGESMRYRAMHDPMQRVARRLDRVQADLHLKPEQLPAWEALRDRITVQAQLRVDHMRSRSRVEHSPEEAMRERADRLRQQAQVLDETAKLLKTLVDQLSPEQRTILRLHQQHQHRAMQMLRMQHRRYSMGPEVSTGLEALTGLELLAGVEWAPSPAADLNPTEGASGLLGEKPVQASL